MARSQNEMWECDIEDMTDAARDFNQYETLGSPHAAHLVAKPLHVHPMPPI